MPIAQVSADCFLAVADKAFSQSPDEFCSEVLFEMIKEQPVLTEGLMRLTTDLAEISDPEDVDGQARTFVMAASLLCLMFRALKTQDEANEMENEIE
jgi:hypothetical protein